MCQQIHELRPIFIPSGTPLPFNLPIYFNIGKWPLIRVYIKNTPNSRTIAPNITTTEYTDIDGFVESFDVNIDGGGSSFDDLYVVINPQTLSICAG